MKAETNVHKIKVRKEQNHSTIIFFYLLSLICLVGSSCGDEEFITDANVAMTTSVDTLTFDTVFTTVGSTTRRFKVYNPSSENVIISSIRLENSGNSKFRINIDGYPQDEVTDIKLLAGDSLYVFAEVTVDPNQPVSVSPFVIEEYLIISSGSMTKRVLLEAWGQNANYFPRRDAQGQILGLTCDNQIISWQDEKPYVIYGLVVIDSCTLVMAAGTEVFVHGGIARTEDFIFDDGGLYFLGDGRLEARGTELEPVVFRTDRLESSFQVAGGQWAGLRFLPGSTGNLLQHTQVYNSIVGVRVDSAASLQMDQSIIAYTSNVGLIGRHSNITVQNSLIHSNGAQSIGFLYGGDYRFDYCTVANYGNQSPALYADNYTCLDGECMNVLINPLQLTLTNSILVGSNDGEVQIIDATAGQEQGVAEIKFDHTLLRYDPESLTLTDDNCIGCYVYDNEPLFLDQIEQIYSLDTMSIARDLGIPISNISFDLIGNTRDLSTPDLGCYEFQ